MNDFRNSGLYNTVNNKAYKRWLLIKKKVLSREATICESWREFCEFAAWHDGQPQEKYMVCESDHYSPGECYFSPKKISKPNPNGGNKSRVVRVQSPEMELFKVTNRAEFCRDNNLNYLGFSNMVNCKTPSYKGWRLFWC